MVGDLTLFYDHYKSIQPWLKRKTDNPNPGIEYLQSIEDTLKASAGDYLDGTEMTLSDVTMVCSLSPLVSFLYSVWEYPNLDKWFQLCMSRDEFQKVLGNPHLVGSKRIGNQVDERPNPMKARLGAESAQKRNVGAKKVHPNVNLKKHRKERKNRNHQRMVVQIRRKKLQLNHFHLEKVHL